MSDLVLTIIGRDRAGIVAALAEDVSFHGGTWKRSELAEIAGTFAGVVVVGVPDERVDELLASLMILREQGLHVTAELVDESTTVPPAQVIGLHFTGEDRRGIVSRISSALTEMGVSIARMGTVTDIPGPDGTHQFEFTARLALLNDTDPDAVLDALHATAEELGVALSIEDVTDDSDNE